jgi:hypothetical protein
MFTAWSVVVLNLICDTGTVVGTRGTVVAVLLVVVDVDLELEVLVVVPDDAGEPDEHAARVASPAQQMTAAARARVAADLVPNIADLVANIADLLARCMRVRRDFRPPRGHRIDSQ